MDFLRFGKDFGRPGAGLACSQHLQSANKPLRAGTKFKRCAAQFAMEWHGRKLPELVVAGTMAM